MKVFTDKNLTQEIKEDDIWDLGIVQAGEEKLITFYLLNNNPTDVYEIEYGIFKKKLNEEDQEVWSPHPELEVAEAPQELSPKGTSELIILVKPLVTIKEGIRAKLYMKYKELWG